MMTFVGILFILAILNQYPGVFAIGVMLWLIVQFH